MNEYLSVRKPSAITNRDLKESLGKIPPQAIDLEEAILGGIILEDAHRTLVLQKLVPEDFYDLSHEEIFRAIKKLADNGDPIDMRSVVNQLKRNGKLELIGGPYKIAELTSKVSSSANIEYYCLMVKEFRIKRDIITFASSLYQMAYDDTSDIFVMVDFINKFPMKIYDDLKTGNEKHIKERIHALAQDINKRTEEKPEISGIPSGFISLDNITRGWQKTDLIIIAARPSMGKTTFILNCLRNAAVDFGVPCALFSLEMSYSQLTDKLVSIETDIGMRTLHDKVFTPLDWDRFMTTTGPLIKAEVYIDDTPAISISQLRINARRLKERYKIKMLVVDYLQLMKGEDGVKTNREQEISAISGGLKRIAKELDIVVIALSQLSREVDKRPMPRIPILSDLRDSGSIEQDADIVAFLWRPEYYKIPGEDYRTYIQGLTKIIIAKHRNGPLGEPHVAMNGSTSKFRSVDSPYMQDIKMPLPPGPGASTPAVTVTDDETPF